MKSILFRSRLAWLGLLWLVMAPLVFAGERPNIIFVFSDQHRDCSWSGGGDPQVKTPQLDRLARGGVIMNRSISNHPLCSPYRASLLTGRYPQSNTIIRNLNNNSPALPTNEVTIATLLKKAGYATGYIGKWHLYPGAPTGAIVPPGPDRHGFDWWRICHNYRQRYDTRYYDDAGKEVVIHDYAPRGQMDLMIEFIQKNAKGPFCVFLSWQPPHSPYAQAPKAFADLYSPETIKLRPNVPKDFDNAKVRRDHAGYFAHISAQDAEMGRLMDKLDQLGIATNTIVCYSSDHGDMLGSFKGRGKNKPFEESIHVPFVIRWPGGIPASRRLDPLFSTVDIAPTLLGLAGLPVLPQMQGFDFSGILRGKTAPGPDSVFIMGGNGGDGGDEDQAPASRKGKRTARRKEEGWFGVRTARHTYAAQSSKGGRIPWVLYDNEKDPYQMHNLIDDPSCASLQKELDAKVESWIEAAGNKKFK